jgi:uncharacterized protein (DUF58 family)
MSPAGLGRRLAALGRAVGIRSTAPATPETRRGAYSSVGELAALESAARDFSFLNRQPNRSLLAGRHGSRIRGRGLAFEELRQYLPGDDIRTIDWRVTARTGKPFVRVYAEDKDRPSLLVIDQRMNMFFGSRRALKSVAAAEAAALCAWRLLAQGDRVGGFVFNDSRIDEARPHRSRETVMRLLDRVARQNGELHAGAGAGRGSAQLDAVLESVAQIARHDHLVIIVSDLEGNGPHTRDLLLRLAAHNDVVVLLIYDPFLLHLPETGEIVVSDGELQVELGFGASRTRKSLASFVDARVEEILNYQHEIGVTVLPISAAEEIAPQIKRLLGQAVWQQRRR